MLRLDRTADILRYSINGHEVLTIPDARVTGARPALRVGAGLKIHISRYDLVTRLAPARWEK